MKKFLMVVLLLTVGCTTTNKSQQKTNASSEQFIRSVSASSVSQWNKSDCRTPVAKYSKKTWKELVNEANACVRAEKWSHVEEIASELARKDTNSPWGPYYLGLSAEKDGNLDRALWMAELTIKRSPGLALAHFQKGRILWKKEVFNESLDSLHEALQLDPNLIDTHLFLGQIFFRDQNFAKAARHFQAVLKVRPRDPTALMGLAECNIHSSDERGALEYLERGNRNYPTDPIFALRQAYVYETLLNDISKAIDVYSSIQAGYKNGKYQRALDFSLTQKIRELEMSVHGTRSLAGSEPQGEMRK